MKYYPNKRFLNEFPDIGKLLNDSFPDEFSLQQKLYHYLHDDFDVKLGYCKNCGNRCRFINLKCGYTLYCSKKCSTNSKEVREKTKKTNIERYGHICTLQSTDIKEKVKQTNLKKYGVDIASKAKSIKGKIILTNLNKYGVKSTMQLKDTQNKKIKTSLVKYGVKYASQSNVVKEKMKKTNLKKYGVEYATQAKQIKNKIAKNNFKKYGTNCVLQIPNIIEKTKQNCFDKYGVEYPMQSKEIQEKQKQTNLNKYGVEYITQVESIKEKIKQTNLEKYGVENVFQSNEIKEKVKKTNLERYGSKFPTQSDEVKEKIKQTNLEKYGICWYCLSKDCHSHSTNNNSKPNLKFAKILDENNIDYKREYNLKSYFYDFKIDNILIEINPTITHNSYVNVFGGDAKEKDYHFKKTNVAKENGYRCIHIFDWDNIDKILNILKLKETLYARNLTLKEVDEKKVDLFLNEYHLQNTCKGQTIYLGLYMSNILVEVMTFGKPRYNKNYEWELLRLCTHKDYKIVGGAEKLFKHFVKTYNPKSIISYCDNSKFSGGVYELLGFKLKKSYSQSKHWYNIKTKQHITDNLLRQIGFDQLFKTNYGKGTSNEELMIDCGFLPVYDCGQKTYSYRCK